ncbi:MAG: Uncharacterised protein [SAR116 cluster bacterium]|nr:MAG: Uncharacterised protein [SAR116 cluster bacterium]
MLFECLDLRFGVGHVFFLQVRCRQIGDTKGNAGITGLTKAKRHQTVTEDHCVLLPAVTIDMVDHVTDLLLCHQLVDKIEGTVRVVRQQVGQLCPARCCLDHPCHTRAIFIARCDPCLDLGMQADRPVAERQQNFLHIGKGHALALFIVTFQRHVIQAKDDILRRHDDRLAICRAEDVVRRHH